MNGTFNQAWTYVAEERTAEHQRKAARQQLLDQAPNTSRTINTAAFTRLISKLAAHIVWRQDEQSLTLETPQVVNGEYIQTTTS